MWRSLDFEVFGVSRFVDLELLDFEISGVFRLCEIAFFGF